MKRRVEGILVREREREIGEGGLKRREGSRKVNIEKKTYREGTKQKSKKKKHTNTIYNEKNTPSHSPGFSGHLTEMSRK